jgi:hypothetical protein
VGHLLHFGNAADCEWAGQGNYTSARHSKYGATGLGGPREGGGNDADRRYSLGLGGYCVVETPRRTGASISDGVYHRVAIICERLQGVFGTGGAVGELSGVDHFSGAIVVEQDLF